MKKILVFIFFILNCSVLWADIDVESKLVCDELAKNLNQKVKDKGQNIVIDDYLSEISNAFTTFENQFSAHDKYNGVRNNILELVKKEYDKKSQKNANFDRLAFAKQIIDTCNKSVREGMKSELSTTGVNLNSESQKHKARYDKRLKEHSKTEEVIANCFTPNNQVIYKEYDSECGDIKLGITDSEEMDKVANTLLDQSGVRSLEQITKIEERNSFERILRFGTTKCYQCFKRKFDSIKEESDNKNNKNKAQSFDDLKQKNAENIKNELAKQKVQTALSYLVKAIEFSEDMSIWQQSKFEGTKDDNFNSLLNTCQTEVGSDEIIYKLYSETKCAQGITDEQRRSQFNKAFKELVIPASNLKLNSNETQNLNFRALAEKLKNQIENRDHQSCPDNNQVSMSRVDFKSMYNVRHLGSLKLFNIIFNEAVKNRGKDNFIDEITGFDKGQKPIQLIDDFINTQDDNLKLNLFKNISKEICKTKSLNQYMRDLTEKEFKYSNCDNEEEINAVATMLKDELNFNLNAIINTSLTADTRLEMLMHDDLSFAKFLEDQDIKKNLGTIPLTEQLDQVNTEKPQVISDIFKQRRKNYCDDYYYTLKQALCFSDKDFEEASVEDKHLAAQKIAEDNKKNLKESNLVALNNLTMSSFICEEVNKNNGALGTPWLHNEAFLMFGSSNGVISQEVPDYLGQLKSDPQIDSFSHFFNNELNRCDQFPKYSEKILAANTLFENIHNINEEQQMVYLPSDLGEDNSEGDNNQNRTAQNPYIQNTETTEPRSSTNNSSSSSMNNILKTASSAAPEPNNTNSNNPSSTVSQNTTIPDSNNRAPAGNTNSNEEDVEVVDNSVTDSPEQGGFKFNNAFNFNNILNKPSVQNDQNINAINSDEEKDKQDIIAKIEKKTKTNLTTAEEDLLKEMDKDDLEELEDDLDDTKGKKRKIKKLEEEIAKLQSEKERMEFQKKEAEYQKKIADLEKSLNEKQPAKDNKKTSEQVNQETPDLPTGSTQIFTNKNATTPTNTNYRNSQAGVASNIDTGASGKASFNSNAPYVNNPSAGPAPASTGIVLNSVNETRYFNNKENQNVSSKNAILKEFIQRYPQELSKNIIEENGKVKVKIPTANGDIFVEQDEIKDKELLKEIMVAKSQNKTQVQLNTAKHELQELKDDRKREYTLIALKLKFLRAQ